MRITKKYSKESYLHPLDLDGSDLAVEAVIPPTPAELDAAENELAILEQRFRAKSETEVTPKNKRKILTLKLKSPTSPFLSTLQQDASTSFLRQSILPDPPFLLQNVDPANLHGSINALLPFLQQQQNPSSNPIESVLLSLASFFTSQQQQQSQYQQIPPPEPSNIQALYRQTLQPPATNLPAGWPLTFQEPVTRWPISVQTNQQTVNTTQSTTATTAKLGTYQPNLNLHPPAGQSVSGTIEMTTG
jgi:hypothetical protein